ncbi:MAG: hypothetical protein KA986_00460 [Aliarcobacter sp.]|nr:hypothetical protein [Aliarcobacter sp.]MBP9766108.1 hypothetical protein [Candidatus Paceibacterota bacterium]
MDSLIKIFQSESGDIRLKTLRFFLANNNNSFSLLDVEEGTRIRKDKLKKELAFLSLSKFLIKNNHTKGGSSYKLNQDFEHKEALYSLVFDFENMNRKIIIDKLKKIGRIKLFYFTGLFLNDTDTEVDILIVADNIKPKEMHKALLDLNSLFASKIRVLIMDVEEYNYRYKMFDRFLRLVLEGKKIVVIDKFASEI